MNVAITIGLAKPGTAMETDSMANTRLLSQGVWHGGPSASFEMPMWAVGERFALDLPSGIFEGIVHEVEDYGATESAEARSVAAVFGGSQPAAEGVRLYVVGTWDGKEGGLTGGRCAFGGFRAHLDDGGAVVTESTLLPEGKKVAYSVYNWVKQARYVLGIDDDGARALLEHITTLGETEPNRREPYQVRFFRKEPALNPIKFPQA